MLRFKYLIIVFAILSLVLISSCTKEANRPFESETKERLKLIPSDITFVKFINVEQIKNSRYYNFLWQVSDNSLKNFIKELKQKYNFNIKNDLFEIYYAENIETKKKYLILYGDFLLSNNNKYDSLEVNNRFYYYNLYDNNTVLLSNDKRFVIKNENGESYESLLDDKNYSIFVNSVRYKNYYWIGIIGGDMIVRLAEAENYKNENLEKVKNAINMISFSFDIRKDMKLNVNFTCSDYLSASLIATGLKNYISGYKLLHPNDPFSDELAKSIIETDIDRINIKSTLNDKSIEKLKNSNLIKKIKINYE